MTPERIEEIHADLEERTDGWVLLVEEVESDDPDLPSVQAFAVLIVAANGVLAVELRINDESKGEVAVRGYNDDEPTDPVVLTLPGMALVTT